MKTDNAKTHLTKCSEVFIQELKKIKASLLLVYRTYLRIDFFMLSCDCREEIFGIKICYSIQLEKGQYHFFTIEKPEQNSTAIVIVPFFWKSDY
ncbi:hypothetical protein ABID99_001377 [Mucilaginibacter sp. OAE612]